MAQTINILMKYSYPIEISNWQIIQDNFKSKIKDHYDKNYIVLSEEETTWLSEKLIQEINKFTGKKHIIFKAIIFIQTPKSSGPIHIDGIIPNDPKQIKWAVNIPLTNSDAEMSWYEGDYTLQTELVKGLPYLNILWHEDPHMAETVELDRPLIVNIDAPHRVKNFSDDYRAILSIRCSPNLF
jgi:hypothetical protein